MTKTLIIRHDSDFRGMIEQNAAEIGYDAEKALEAYLDAFERIALDEIDDLDDVDVERIDAHGCTPSTEIVCDDGSEMSSADLHQLDSIHDRALSEAMDAVS